MVQQSDDDVNRALAAFSAPSISYRDFAFRPSASAEPKPADPITGGFRLLVAAIPEAAELGRSCDSALLPPADASVETLPEQAPLTKKPHLVEGRLNAPASTLRPRAPDPALPKVDPQLQTSSESNPLTGASVRPAPDHRAPDIGTAKTPLAAVFSALNGGSLPPETPAEVEQKLRNIFSML